MKPIAEKFTYKGFTHRQIWRKGMVCVYRRNAVTGQSENFEVVVLKVDKGGKIRTTDPKTGKVSEFAVEGGERYPSSEAWGARGWSYRDKDDAMAKAESLAA